MPNRFQQLTRLPEWWQAKAGNLLGLLYLVMALAALPFTTALWYLGPALLTIVGIGGFGHFVNDWLDIDADQQAGKPNRVATLRPSLRFLVLVALLLIAFLPWLILPWTPWTWYLLALEFGLLIAYALPPIRLKERAFLGVMADALYAHAIPAVLAAYTFLLLVDADSNWLFVLLIIFIWQLALGVHGILIHQLVDLKNDQRTKTKTFALKVGAIRLSRLITFVCWPLEMIAFIGLLVYGSAVFFSWYFLLPAVLLILKYITLFPTVSPSFFARNIDGNDHQLMAVHYHRFWPHWNLLLAAILVDVRFLVLLLLHQLLSHPSTLWNYLRVIVNYGIYLLRRVVLGQTDQQARGKSETLTSDSVDGQTDELPHPVPVIALANRNLNKYTETFVRQHLTQLPFTLVPVYGRDDYLPVLNAQGERIREEHWSLLLQWIEEKIVGLSSEELEVKALQQHLLDQKVELVLAEFGTVGAALLPMVRPLDLPLVVIFYGYDAFHARVLRDLSDDYQDLFSYASAVIGVSQDICQQLIELGAPSHTVHYLPCPVNLSLFRYTEHRHNPPIFLTVGRFAETKSPHLTILAFSKVVKEIPDAQLVMVGRDGGGELFEACHILVQALGLSEQVTFKGILSPEEVYAEMQKARVFVQHSLTTPISGDKEGTPVAIMEAMACGLPVVSTRHAGIPEMITHGETGWLVDEYDVQGMAEAMVLLGRDDALIAEIGLRASDWIRSNPLVKEHHQKLAAIIRACL